MEHPPRNWGNPSVKKDSTVRKRSQEDVSAIITDHLKPIFRNMLKIHRYNCNYYICRWQQIRVYHYNKWKKNLATNYFLGTYSVFLGPTEQVTCGSRELNPRLGFSLYFISIHLKDKCGFPQWHDDITASAPLLKKTLGAIKGLSDIKNSISSNESTTQEEVGVYI